MLDQTAKATAHHALSYVMTRAVSHLDDLLRKSGPIDVKSKSIEGHVTKSHLKLFATVPLITLHYYISDDVISFVDVTPGKDIDAYKLLEIKADTDRDQVARLLWEQVKKISIG